MTQGYRVEKVSWVKPNVPTLLGDLERLVVPPTDLSFASMESALVLPGPIDPVRLEAAVAHALHYHPHAAGRLLRPDEAWIIKLSNSAIPIAYGISELELTEELLEGCHPHISEPLEVGFDPATNDAPLVKILVTTWPKTAETSFSLTWHHALGDGSSKFFFMTTLERHYKGFSPAPVPTFEKYLNHEEPTLERTLLHETLLHVPHLAIDYSTEVFHKMLDESLVTTSHVSVQFSADQLEAIHAAARKSAGSNIVTVADALGAYLCTVLSRISPAPIQQIINVIDYRGFRGVPGKYEPPGRLAVGNVILQKFSEKLPPDHNTPIGQYALLLRKNLTQSRDPEFVRRVVALSQELRVRSADTGRISWWWTYEDGIGLNNLSKHPTNLLDFGYKGQSRCYYFGDWERYFRFLPGNPERLPDGTWDRNEGSVRVFTRLKHELKQLFLKAVEEDMRDLEGGLARL